MCRTNAEDASLRPPSCFYLYIAGSRPNGDAGEENGHHGAVGEEPCAVEDRPLGRVAAGVEGIGPAGNAREHVEDHAERDEREQSKHAEMERRRVGKAEVARIKP